MSKLDWMNGHYIRQLAPADLAERIAPFWSEESGIPLAQLRADPALAVVVPLIQERIKTLAEGWDLVDFAFVDEITYEPQMLVAKGLTAAQSLAALRTMRSALETLPFEEAALDPALRDLAVASGLKAGQLFGILRVATTGKAVAPPIFGSLVALGRARTLRALPGGRTASGADGGRLEAESWKLEAGNWKLEAGNWKLETGNWKRNISNQPATSSLQHPTSNIQHPRHFELRASSSSSFQLREPKPWKTPSRWTNRVSTG